MEFVSIKRNSRGPFENSEKVFVNLKSQCLDLNSLRLKNIEDVLGLEKLTGLRRLELQGDYLTEINGPHRCNCRIILIHY